MTSIHAPPPPIQHPTRSPLPSSVVIPSPLPSLSFLESQSLLAANRARQAYVLKKSMETAIETPIDAFSPPPEDLANRRRSSSSSSTADEAGKGSVGSGSKGPNKNGQFEAFHVLRAIEKKDVMMLMEIRNQAFELLVGTVGGSTPLVHAMRHGKTHREVAILLTGAISRRVNDLTDSDLANPTTQTKSLLRAIRANLKIAIGYGLQTSQTDLLASYLQVIIMSEGDRFIKDGAWNVGLALRSGKAVEQAEEVMNKWVSRELKKEAIAAVGEYLANAIGDLVLLGMWNLATDTIPGEAIPIYFFARDDRITNALAERIADLQKQGTYDKLPRNLKKQLEIGVRVMGMRNLGGKERVALLKKELEG